MKRPQRYPIRIPSREFLTIIRVVVLGLAASLTMIAQPPGTPPTGTPPTPISDTSPAGESARVPLGGGKYKKVYRNKAGQIFKEEIFEGGGGMFQPDVLLERREISSVNANGTPAVVKIETFEDIPNTLNGRKVGTHEVITYNDAGEPIQKLSFPTGCKGPYPTVRIITTWAAGTREPTVRIQERDPYSGSWLDLPYQPMPPEKTGPGPISSNTNPDLPNGTTATAQTRVRPNGDDSLLISLTSPQTFDSLQITLPNSKPFSVGSLPQNWTMKQDGKRLVFSGSGTDAINIRLDAPRGGEPIPDKPIEIEPGYRLKRLFRIAATARSLPPITNVGDLTSALILPPEITPGQPFLATPKPGFTDGTWRIANGPVVQWINTGDPNNRRLLFKVTENESPRPTDRAFISYQYYDQYNELILDGTHSKLRIIESAGGPRASDVLAGERFAFSGQSTCASGNLPKWEDWFFFTLDGTTPLLPVSASPTTITFAIPPTVTPGPHNIGPACSTSSQLPINILGVEGSIDSNALLRGESTTMRLRVIGTDESLPIAITNNTTAIINIDGGVQQTVNSSGGSTNLVTRSVKGTMRGNFQIDYRLDYPVCGGGSNAREPEKKTP